MCLKIIHIQFEACWEFLGKQVINFTEFMCFSSSTHTHTHTSHMQCMDHKNLTYGSSGPVTGLFLSVCLSLFIIVSSLSVSSLSVYFCMSLCHYLLFVCVLSYMSVFLSLSSFCLSILGLSFRHCLFFVRLFYVCHFVNFLFVSSLSTLSCPFPYRDAPCLSSSQSLPPTFYIFLFVFLSVILSCGLSFSLSLSLTCCLFFCLLFCLHLSSGF